MIAFVLYELRTDEPMLPMEFFAERSFVVTNAISLAMFFGMFGSIFFLSQYLQNVLAQHPVPGRPETAVVDRGDDGRRAAGGFFSERYGSRLFMVGGLALQAIALGWLAPRPDCTRATSA